MFIARVAVPASLPRYTVHQFLYGYFPGHSRDHPRPFLFRHVSLGRCLLLSATPPAEESAPVKIQAGRTYAMDAILVPVVKKFRFGQKFQPTPITDCAQRRDWLATVLARSGAALGMCVWHDRPWFRFRHGNGHQITLAATRAQFMAFVTDANAFTDLMLRGVGPGKAFGCGMLALSEWLDGISSLRDFAPLKISI